MTTVVNYNPSSLTALNALSKNTKAMNRSIERLSTGFRINRASDGPAALVISERLRAQIAGLTQAVDNSERAQNIVATAEAALVEINSLLTEIQDLVIEAANDGALSEEEILANQAQIDDAIGTIDRITNTTNFAGKDLLNGEVGYTMSGLNSGVTTGVGITEIDIQGAALRGTTTSIQVDVEIRANASQAQVQTSAVVGSSGAQLLIRGNDGSELITFNSSQTQSGVAAAVNAVSDSTGVQATVSGAFVLFNSVGYGSDEFVEIQDLSTAVPASQYINSYDTGQDISATVNGISAAGTGLKLSIDTFEIDADISVSSSFYTGNAGADGVASTSFNIIAGGMTFQLGSGTRASEKEFMGISRVGSDNLGSREAGGFLSDLVTGGSFTLLNDADTASKIIAAAIDDVTSLRARLGAFESNTLESNINSLNIAIENLTASESRIRDTDFAVETAEFSRTQILVQAGTAILAQANTLPQTVLALLG